MAAVQQRLSRLRALLHKRAFARHVIVLAGGATLGQGLIALASPILSRLYSPEDFGALAVYMSLFALLLSVNSLRYEYAIPLPDDAENRANLVVLTLGLVGLTTLVFTLGVVLLGAQIAQWTNAPTLTNHLWMLPLALLGGGVYQALNYWALRREAFVSLAYGRLFQGISHALLQIVLGLMGTGTFGLVFGHTIGQLSSSLPLLRLVWSEERAHLSAVNWTRMRELAVRYRRFPLLMTWSSLLNTAGLNLPAIIISAAYSSQVAGWFSLSQRVTAIPMYFIGLAVSQVYFGKAAAIGSQEKEALKAFFARNVRRLFWIGLLPSLFLLLTGPWLFAFVFGASWWMAGEYARLLSPMLLAQFIISPLAQTLVVLERQDLQFIWDTARLGIVLAAFVCAFVLRVDHRIAIGLYSAGMTAAYGWLLVINWRVLNIKQEHAVV